MKTVIKTISFILFVIAFITVSSSVFYKVFPDIKMWSNVQKYKNQVNSYNIEQTRKYNQIRKKEFYWKEYKVDKYLKGPEIGKNDWSYPYYIVKHSKGFENTMSDIVSHQDTIHIIHKTKCFSLLKKEGKVFLDTLSEINICRFRVKDDLLELKLFEESVSNAEVIYIKLKGRKFEIDYKTSYAFPTKKIKWEIKKSTLKLNQFLPVKIDSLLIGELYLELDETIFEKNKKPTFRSKIFKGEFQVKIEKNPPNYF